MSRTLPSELWLAVASYFTPGVDSSTFASMSCVSRQLCNIFQPLLYQAITAEQLKRFAFGDSLQSTDRGARLAAHVFDVAVVSYLDHPDPIEADPDSDSDHLDHMLTLDEALGSSKAQWKTIEATLHLCPLIRRLRFTLDSNASLEYRDKTFVPAAADLTGLPFKQWLTHLVIRSPNGPQLDLSSFGHLIQDCPLLDRLSLHFVNAFDLFEPVLERMSHDSTYRLPLRFLEWDEKQITGTAYVYFEEQVEIWQELLCFRRLSFQGHWVHFDEGPLLHTQWPDIIQLSFDQEISPNRSDMRASTPLLKELATFFPSLQRLKLILWCSEAVPLLSAKIPFLHLDDLTLHHYIVKESSLASKVIQEELLVVIQSLASRSVGPRLRRLEVRLFVDVYDYLGTRRSTTGEAGRWAKQISPEDLVDAASTLQEFVLRENELWVRVLRRGQDGMFVEAYNSFGC